MQKSFSIIKVAGRDHVITDCPPRKTSPEFIKKLMKYRQEKEGQKRNEKKEVDFDIPDANYMNTGKALCGILRKGESLDDWIKRTYR